jgi:peptide/nickel transport system permease protein
MAIFAPIIATHDPEEVLIGKEDVKKRQPPCIHALGCPEDQPQHILGTDGNVRDLFSRIVYGSRVSLRVGFIVVGFAALIGTVLGAIAGYAGSGWDNGIMRLLDVVLSFPALLLAIAIVFVMEDRSLTNAMIAVAIVSIPAYARVVRSSVITLREADYVEASRALGASNTEILFRRILPNALPPLIVLATLGFATAILDTAALSFLGLGAQEPTPEWGTMLGRERNQLFSAPHLVFSAGIAISVTVLAFNLLGDGLRDALDPRLVQGGSGGANE